MLLEEFREALATLPPYAPVLVRGEGLLAPIGAVDYDSGIVRVIVDDVEILPVPVDDDADSDRGADDGAYLSTFRWREGFLERDCLRNGNPFVARLAAYEVETLTRWLQL